MADLDVGAPSAQELLSAMTRFQQMVDDYDKRVKQLSLERAGAAKQLQKYTEKYTKLLNSACRDRSRSPDPLGRPSPKPEDVPRSSQKSRSPQNRHAEQDSQRASTIAYDAMTQSPGDDPGDEHRSAACAPRVPLRYPRVDLTFSSDEESSSAKSQDAGKGKEPAAKADKGKEPAAKADKGKEPAQKRARGKRRCPWYTGKSVIPCKFEMECPYCCPCPKSAEVQRLAKEQGRGRGCWRGRAKEKPALSAEQIAQNAMLVQKAADSVIMQMPAWQGTDGWHSEIKKNAVLYSWLDQLQQKTYPLVENTPCADFLSIATKLEERECCLLVLNLVSSTLSCIRQPRPRRF